MRVLLQQPDNPYGLHAAQRVAGIVEHLAGLPDDRSLSKECIGLLDDLAPELATLRTSVDGLLDALDLVRSRHQPWMRNELQERIASGEAHSQRASTRSPWLCSA